MSKHTLSRTEKSWSAVEALRETDESYRDQDQKIELIDPKGESEDDHTEAPA